jgi:tetratricopeptide (TPR) repeat protein
LSLVEAGDLASALSHFRKELSLFESLGAADPRDAQARRNQSLARKQIGDVLMRNAEFGGALAQYRAALEIDRNLASADPGNSQALLDLSFSEGKVGSALGKLDHGREALAMLRSSVASQESLAAKDPNHILLHNHLANSYTRLANFLFDSANTRAAVEYYRKAIDARLAFSAKSPNSSMNRGALAECYANLGKALGPHDHADALRQYDNAVELLEPLTAADRSNAQYRIALADALSSAAQLYARTAAQDNEPGAGIQHCTKAVSLYHRSLDLWSGLNKTGKLPPERRQPMQDVSSELQRCNDSLAKLQKEE